MNEKDALALLDGRARFGQRLGLETIEGMLAALGDFHKDLRVVHVAGTNGKGSVCAFIAAALQAAGHKTGLYTSPHLVRFHERIRISDDDITSKQLVRAMKAIQPALEKYPEATYFEVATVLALRHFKDEGVDVVVLETGLGGRLDATNVFTKPLVTVITNVSSDHAETLGDTVGKIAGEKGGIIKRGVPLVTGATGEAREAIAMLAKERTAPLTALGDEFIPIPHEADDKGQTFEVSGLREYGTVRIPLLGEHQLENAALALAALDHIDTAGLSVPTHAARDGFARTRWPGRLQEIPGKPRLILDGAHNPAGIEALTKHLAAQGIKPVVLFGSLSDKDWAAMVELLVPHIRDAIVTRVPSSRALEPMEAARMFSREGVFGMVVDDPGHALRTAKGVAGPDGVVLVTGSLYLVGAVLAQLQK